MTAPTSGLTIRLGDPVTAHVSVLDCPGLTIAGVAVKLVMLGELPTVTVAVAVIDPNEFVADKVYVVVAEGVTLTEVPVTAPTPGLTIGPGDPVTAHLRVLDCPGLTVAGVAVKLVMVGELPTRTVTDFVADPKLLVAVRV